ncbi:MAG: helix-turn-helix domain-containing protein [Alphaproteobacteria bacterium]|nr:helix-turn-helix domain-containing protein [Alphaproteobacteria bacterium]
MGISQSRACTSPFAAIKRKAALICCAAICKEKVVQQLLKDGKKTVPEIAHILKVTRQTVYNAMKFMR